MRHHVGVLTLIFTLSFSDLAAYAREEFEDKSTHEQLKEAYRLVRRARKEARRQEREEAASNIDLVVCVDCEKLTDLTGEMNKIMREMIETDQVNPLKVGAIEEIEKLEALYHTTLYDIEEAKRLDHDFPFDECTVFPQDVYLREMRSEPLDTENLTEVFTKDFPLERIRSAHWRSYEKGRFYYYRGARPHHNMIIRIHVPKEGRAQVKYFYRGQLPDVNDSQLVREVEKNKINANFQPTEEDLREQERKKIDGYEFWGSLGRYESESSEWAYGFAIAHKDNLPRRLVLLKGKDRSQISENVSLNTEVEISDRDQEVNLDLDYKGTRFFRAQVEADGDYRAEVPLTFSFSEYALSTQGSVALTEEGQEASLALSRDGNSLIQVRKINNQKDGRQRLVIGNTFNEVMGGRLSMEYEKDKGDDLSDETVWLRYRAVF